MRCSVGLLVAVVLASLPSPAQGAVYEVRACADARNPSGWVVQNTSPSTISTAFACPAGPGQTLDGLTLTDRSGSANTPAGAVASWSVTAPATTWLRSLAVQRYLGKRDAAWSVQILTAEGVVLDTCEIAFGQGKCERGVATGTGQANSATYPGLHTPSVSLRLRCAATRGQCSNGFALRQAWIAVYDVVATVEDPNPPAVGALSGSVLNAGWHRGTDTADFSASDASGVKQLRLLAGTAELARRDQPCDYTRMQPCPATARATLTFDASAVPDGTHSLRAIAVDAAGQERETVATYRVDRHAPEGPVGLEVTRAGDGAYSAAWRNPEQGTAAPIVAARYALCDPSPGLTCSEPRVVSGAGIGRIDGIQPPDPDAGYMLRVWLEDEAGNVDPANAAAVPLGGSSFPSSFPSPRAVDTRPPVLQPGPRPSAQLRITRARRSGSELVLSGTIARRATAAITAKLSTGRSTRVLASARVRPRQGRWTVRVRLTPRLRTTARLYLHLGYAGQADFGKTTLHRRLASSTRRTGAAAVEFSVERAG